LAEVLTLVLVEVLTATEQRQARVIGAAKISPHGEVPTEDEQELVTGCGVNHHREPPGRCSDEDLRELGLDAIGAERFLFSAGAVSIPANPDTPGTHWERHQ